MNGKTRINWFLSVLCLWLGTKQMHAQNVAEISFDFLEKTDQRYLEHFIDNQVGQPFDSLQAMLDFQQIRNLDIFYDLTWQVDTSDQGLTIRYSGKEKITTLPIINFGLIEENFWFRLGAFDANFRGKGELFGAYYTFYDRSSFNVFYKNPFIYHSRWGTEINLQKLSTLEPVYFRGEEAIYNYDNITTEVLISHWFNIRNQVKFGVAYLSEKYNREDQNATAEELPNSLELSKWIFKSKYEWGQLNFYSNLLEGVDNQSFFETVVTRSTQEFFWKFLNEFRAFKRLGRRGNFGTRLRFGLSGKTDSPFVPFVLDSYINIRGSGNRVARGIGELVGNFEYRYNFNEWNWGAVQGVVFWDLGTWRSIDDSLKDMFDRENVNSFIGLGGRVYVKRFYNLIFRADVGFNAKSVGEYGIVLGLGQYF